MTVPKSDEEHDEESDEGKKEFRIAELNEIDYSEVILSLDVKNRIATISVKGYKNEDYIDGTVANARERLINTFEPIAALYGQVRKTVQIVSLTVSRS